LARNSSSSPTRTPARIDRRSDQSSICTRVLRQALSSARVLRSKYSFSPTHARAYWSVNPRARPRVLAGKLFIVSTHNPRPYAVISQCAPCDCRQISAASTQSNTAPVCCLFHLRAHRSQRTA
jgi:hypothetical protein